MSKIKFRLKLPVNLFYNKRTGQFGWGVTALLALGLFLLFSSMWALFIAGPARMHEEAQQQVISKIEKEVSGIQGLSEHIFDYVTWNGYTSDTLYWFNQKGEQITTRPIESLNYDQAKADALEKYGIEASSIQLAYGYNTPCYEIEGSDQILLLDYDTLTKVYQRQVN